MWVEIASETGGDCTRSGRFQKICAPRGVYFSHYTPHYSLRTPLSLILDPPLLKHPDVVSAYLEQERALNRMAVVHPEDMPHIHCHISPFGVIPKKSKPGHWRLIVHLSSPENASVNDGINKDMCSTSYITTDWVIDHILSLGRGTLMAKADIKQAYRMVPVHPDDRLLLGVQWQGEVLVDKVLPFGLHSAPMIFTAIADALQWIMVRHGVSNIAHYLDDFVTLGPPGSSICQQNIVATCALTGTPLEITSARGHPLGLLSWVWN